MTSRRQRRDPERLRRARARGQAQAGRPAVPRLAGGDPGGRPRRERSIMVHNELVDENGSLRAEDPTGARRSMRAGAALGRLQGHPDRGCALRRPTRADPQRRRSRADGARLRPRPRPLRGGWIKRGPSGVIGTNKKDANETVATCSRTSSPAAARARRPRAHRSRGAGRRARTCATSPSRTGS